MTIWERIQAALAPLNVPASAVVYKHGDDDGNYPDLFLVYSIGVTTSNYADNKEIERYHPVEVTALSKQAGKLNSLPDIIGVMKAAGFTFQSTNDIPYDLDTELYGQIYRFYFMEDLLNGNP